MRRCERITVWEMLTSYGRNEPIGPCVGASSTFDSTVFKTYLNS